MGCVREPRDGLAGHLVNFSSRVFRPTAWVDWRRLAVEVHICKSMAQRQQWQEMRERQPHRRFI